MGACLFALVSIYGLGFALPGSPDTRIAANIVTGVGFLGAGAILRSGPAVRGLATAASLWLVAGVGMAVAFGHYLPAVLAAAIAAVVLRGAKNIEAPMLHRFGIRQLSLVAVGDSRLEMDAVIAAVSHGGSLVRHVDMAEHDGVRTFTVLAEVAARRSPDRAIATLRQLATIKQINLSA